MRAEAPAWPPSTSPSTTRTESPSEAAYTAVARPAGPESDHGDVVEGTGSECRGDAEPGAGLFIRGPLEHAAARADQKRQVLGREGKIVEELAAALTRAVENQMGIAVAGQEHLQAEKLGGAGAAEQDRTDATLQQADAPQDEGAHDQLAELRGTHDERAQAGRIERQRDASVHTGARTRRKSTSRPVDAARR